MEGQNFCPRDPEALWATCKLERVMQVGAQGGRPPALRGWVMEESITGGEPGHGISSGAGLEG